MLLDERPCASGGLALSALTSTTYDSSSKKLSTAGAGLRGVGLTSRSLGGTADICLRQGDGTLYDLSYRVLVGSKVQSPGAFPAPLNAIPSRLGLWQEERELPLNWH